MQQRRAWPARLLARLFWLPLLLAVAVPAQSQAPNQTIYTDSLQGGWQNWSWATVNFGNTSPVHTGSDSVSVVASSNSALYLHQTAFDSTPYASLTFWINGGATGGQHLQVQATLGGTAQAAYPLATLAANTWTQVTIPLSSLGVASKPNLDGFWVQDTTGTTQPAFYVDDITILSTNSPPPPNPAVTLSVDANAGRHAISPLIYGVAFAGQTQLQDLNVLSNRSGGNGSTRYNWQLNATNHASDYFFESIGSSDPTPGGDTDSFVSGTQAAGAQSLITIPMLGWVANLGASRSKLDGFSVAKYGAQQQVDPYWTDAGNGVLSSGANVTGNNPNDADVPSTTSTQTAYVNHLLGKWGTAAANGVKYYIMDNEPSIWQGTHRDVHPTGATMDEVKNDILAYAGMVKGLDPNALVVGPEEWGWTGYLYSGYDQQYGGAHGWGTLPDRNNHGGADYLPWLLGQLQANNTSTGKRLLDVFSVHFYPQGGEYGNDVSPTMQLLRNRSTRQLWDPNYVSESWINTQVQLIPRIKGWVNSYYPGTKTAITEYNWGAEGSINGATALADVLGIFGREGLDMANYWTYPDPSTPTYKAIKLFRNYDGSKSTFGDTSVSDSAPNPDNVSSFASVRSSDGALTVVVISKYLSGTTPVTVSLANFTAGSTAQAWQLTSSNAITRLADVPVSGGSITATLPAQSVTLFVVPPGVTTVTGLYSTGLNSSGGALADGAQDPYWTITAAPAGMTTGPAYVTNQAWPVAAGVWTPDSASSKWVSPIAAEGNHSDQPGSYTYKTTFTVTGNPAVVRLSGRILSDSGVTAVRLNGVVVSGLTAPSFSTWTSFSINSGFQSGTNTLEFVMQRTGTSPNPSGLRVEVSAATGTRPTLTGLFSSGLDNSGAPLADSTPDPHWAITAAPSGMSTGQAQVTVSNAFPVGGGAWMADSSTSKWVSPIANEGAGTDAPGAYTYQTTFTITGDPSTVQLTGQVAVDNNVTDIKLNGHSLGITAVGFQAWVPITIPSGYFVAGTNTLQVVTLNGGPPNGPSGLRIELANATP